MTTNTTDDGEKWRCDEIENVANRFASRPKNRENALILDAIPQGEK